MVLTWGPLQFSWWNQYRLLLQDPQLMIVAAYKQDELVGVLPGYLCRLKIGGQNIRAFRFLGSEFEATDYIEIIQENTHQQDIPRALLDFLITHTVIDLISLSNILDGQDLQSLLQSWARDNDISFRLTLGHHCPYINVQGSWDEFVAGLGKNMRYNIRRRSRKLFDKFQADVNLLTDRAKIASSLESLFSLHKDRFTSKGEVSRFRADARSSFHKELAYHFFEQDMLRFFTLQVEQKTIASMLCYQYKNVLFYFQAGMDPAWEKESPGLVLMGQVIKYAHDNQLKLFDFMRGDESYKFRWTQEVQDIVICDIGMSFKGRCALRSLATYLLFKKMLKRMITEERWLRLKRMFKK